MIDRRYQRKPKPDHPWVGWRPGLFSSADKQRSRKPMKKEPHEDLREQESAKEGS